MADTTANDAEFVYISLIILQIAKSKAYPTLGYVDRAGCCCGHLSVPQSRTRIGSPDCRGGARNDCALDHSDRNRQPREPGASWIGSYVSGAIGAIYVDFNSPVKAGRLLRKIDPRVFQAQLDLSAIRSTRYGTSESA
jgi:hypothetical protein